MAESTKTRGDRGELLAEKYLRKAGYRLLERNYRKPFGEIDIIAEQGDCLVFVEVKLRKNSRYGTPAQAVNFKKQQKIIRTAQAYLAEGRCFDRNIRFDIIEVYDGGAVPALRHLKGAFGA
ncbi:MAG: YraN family protein [Eubacterium sp.]|nr:YraN family protein [Eubacterium sp.]